MFKARIFLIILIIISNNVLAFEVNKDDYYKALDGDGQSSDLICNWFQVFHDGQIIDNGKVLDTSVTTIDKLCLIAAKKGFKRSQKIVGLKYAKMNSKRNAIKWLTLAAEQGEIDVYGMLGELYAAHAQIDRDYENAFYWYKKASESGEVLSQCQLGLLYANGQGTLKSYKEARYWIKKGYEGAKTYLEKRTCKEYWDAYDLGN